jgi:hypothetical protein
MIKGVSEFCKRVFGFVTNGEINVKDKRGVYLFKSIQEIRTFLAILLPLNSDLGCNPLANPPKPLSATFTPINLSLNFSNFVSNR